MSPSLPAWRSKTLVRCEDLTDDEHIRDTCSACGNYDLAMLAVVLLSLQPSTSQVEGFFSRVKRVVCDEHRSNLSCARASQQMFLMSILPRRGAADLSPEAHEPFQPLQTTSEVQDQPRRLSFLRYAKFLIEK